MAPVAGGTASVRMRKPAPDQHGAVGVDTVAGGRVIRLAHDVGELGLNILPEHQRPRIPVPNGNVHAAVLAGIEVVDKLPLILIL